MNEFSQLYVCRHLLNANDLVQWAREQGFETVLPNNHFHTTIAFSKEKVEWDKSMEIHNKLTNTSSKRSIEVFGEAVVLRFESNILMERWAHFINDLHASWDYDSYKPHVSLTWNKGKLDVKKVIPYNGPLIFGPEVFSKLDSDWSDKITEQPLQENRNSMRQFIDSIV